MEQSICKTMKGILRRDNFIQRTDYQFATRYRDVTDT